MLLVVAAICGENMVRRRLSGSTAVSDSVSLLDLVWRHVLIPGSIIIIRRRIGMTDNRRYSSTAH